MLLLLLLLLLLLILLLLSINADLLLLRMPRYYYCVREAHTLISLASPSFGCALSMHIHAPWLVVLTVLAVFLTPLNLPPKDNLYTYINVFFWPIGIFFSSMHGSFLVLSAPWHAGNPPGPRTQV